MDLTSANALLLACKNNRVQSILPEAYKEDVREFTRSVPAFDREVQPLRAPADQCREGRGDGRCRGHVSEIAVAQCCSYHQVPRTADLDIDNGRLLRMETHDGST